MARHWSLFLLVIRMAVIVVAEPREDAALLWLRLGLVVQPHIFESFLGYLIMAFARATLLH